MIFALSGPSGIGKGFAKEAILKKNPNVKEAIWYTTRDLRPGEKNRESISEIEFTVMQNSEKLALVQELFEHRYGILKESLLSSDDLLTEIHPFIVDEAKNINPNIILVGMVTDDTELLFERLSQKRKTETPKEIAKRVAAAEREIEAIRKNYKLFDAIIFVSKESESAVGRTAQILYQTFLERGKENV